MITRLGPYEYSRDNSEFGFMLMSDLHIGAAETDIRRIERDLATACDNGWDILINGDVMELIIFQDRKRYTPNVLDSGIAANAAQVDAHIDMAADVLAPYADNIRLIGCGNHETAILKYHGTDVTARLIAEIGRRTTNDSIVHGGYTGAVVLNFRREGAERPSGCHQYKIWYHHGFGGSAPVTKGMIDFSRVNAYVEDADVTWLGHKHQRTISQNVALRIPRQGSELQAESRWNIMTSHYHKHCSPQFTKAGHYKPNWNRERGAPESPNGGAALLLSVNDHKITASVKVSD